MLKVDRREDRYNVIGKLTELGNERIAQFGSACDMDVDILRFYTMVTDDIKRIIGRVSGRMCVIRVRNQQTPIIE